jgi:hypothetical protein
MTNEEKAFIHDMTVCVEAETDNIEEWQVKLLTRTIFQEALPEQPWVLHTKMEPKIKVHLLDPTKRPKEDQDYVCQCNDRIPPQVMQKYFFLKSICEGKRAGQK